MKIRNNQLSLSTLFGFWFYLFSCLISPSSLFAAPQSVAFFGPEQFTRTFGATNVFTQTFTVPSYLVPPFSLNLMNGASQNRGTSIVNAVSSGSVFIDGMEVVKQSDFSKVTAVINKQLNLSPGSHQLEVKLDSAPNSSITLSLIGTSTAPFMNLNIISPSDGSTVSQPEVLVQGTIQTNISEFGISVNHIPALINGNSFIADHIPLVQGDNTVTVEGTSLDGTKFQKSIHLYALAGPYIQLTSNVLSDISPLTVTLTVDPFLSAPVASTSITFSGPATPVMTQSNSSTYQASMNTEGLYLFTLTITDTSGKTYKDQLGIQVMSQAALNSLLQGKWNGMITALGKGDTTTALAYIAPERQQGYQAIISALGSQIPSILATAQSFQFVSLSDSMVKYKLLTNENGRTFSYNVIFIKNWNGLWKIFAF